MDLETAIFETLPQPLARQKLHDAFKAEEVAFLGIDLQWDYFFAERIAVRAENPKSDVGRRIIEEHPKVATRTYEFLNAAENTGIPLHRIWTVHSCFPGIPKKAEHGSWAVRRELVIRPRTEDDVFTKEKDSSYFETPFEDIAKNRGKHTFVVAGGLLERCVMGTVIPGQEVFSHNFVVMPDLIAAKRGVDTTAIRGRFIESATPQVGINGWLAAMDGAEVLKIAREALRPSPAALTLAA